MYICLVCCGELVLAGKVKLIEQVDSIPKHPSGHPRTAICRCDRCRRNAVECVRRHDVKPEDLNRS